MVPARGEAPRIATERGRISREIEDPPPTERGGDPLAASLRSGPFRQSPRLRFSQDVAEQDIAKLLHRLGRSFQVRLENCSRPGQPEELRELLHICSGGELTGVLCLLEADAQIACPTFKHS